MDDDVVEFYMPSVITIKTPIAGVIRRGKGAKRIHTTPISVRYSDTEAKRLRAAARLLGMDQSQFIRWCTVQAGLEIAREYHRQTLKQMLAPKEQT